MNTVLEQNEWAIDVKNLNKSFHDKPAVIDLSLQVKRGEIFGFLGPNGSGKTTTIRMLCGLLIPDSGSGQCLGYNILTQSNLIKLQVGYMTQRFSLYEDLTVFENLDFTARMYQINARDKQIAKILADLGLGPVRDQLAGTLSGGWKQRLALAAALLHNPKLLLLDEPTAGVDPKARRDFWDHIHRLSEQGITTLVSTHYMDEVERCHRIAYIAHGHLLVHGTLAEVIAQTKLTTWVIHGPNLNKLAQELQILPGIEQASIFGNSLHVSGKDSVSMAQSIVPYQKNSLYTWQQVEPNMEDVFISLVSGGPEKYYD